MLNVRNAMAEGTFGFVCDTFYLKGVCSRDILRKKDIIKLCLYNYKFIISAVGLSIHRGISQKKIFLTLDA
jgi:hypothetical protein